MMFIFSLILVLLAVLSSSTNFAAAVTATDNFTSTSHLQTQSYQNIVFVQPIFTQAAYSDNGFYYHYTKKCDSKCLTVHIPFYYKGSFVSGGVSNSVLLNQNFSHITDVDIDKNPQILKKYDKVILLHNEYVTRKEFNAITQHPHVIYLYPNTLFAEVKADYDNNTITLIRGHGYPNESIQNGFDWKFDNTKFEYDVTCLNWHFYDIDNNGKMLSCYPEKKIYFDQSLLQAITDLPSVIKPTPLVVIASGSSRSQECASKSSCFQPYSEMVITGHTVSWINKDSISHTVTSGRPSDSLTGTIFRSSLIKSGNSFSHTFTEEGTYNYFCVVHPWLTGEVIVGKQGAL
jgi:plastocyanin